MKDRITSTQQLFYTIWIMLIFITKSNTQDSRTLRLPSYCHKEYIIKEYIKKDRLLEHDILNAIMKDCQPMMRNCMGADNLEVVYAQAKNDFYFIATSDIDKKTTQGCWGFGLEVIHNGQKFIRYFNFFNKTSRFRYSLKVIPGHSYTFTLISLPTTTTKESITLKAPDICGNEVLDILYKKLRNEEICLGCNAPDLEERFSIANDACQQSPFNRTARDELLNELTCDYDCNIHLPELRKKIITKSSGNTISTCMISWCFILLLVQIVV